MTEYQALLDLVFSACFGWTIKLGKFWRSLLGQKLTVDKASPGGRVTGWQWLREPKLKDGKAIPRRSWVVCNEGHLPEGRSGSKPRM